MHPPSVDFKPPRNADGNLACPFTWQHLALNLDRAANNISMDSFLGHRALLNIHVDWDGEHDAKNSGNSALKENNQWRFFVTMVACHNATHGSAMAPARHKQIVQAWGEVKK